MLGSGSDDILLERLCGVEGKKRDDRCVGQHAVLHYLLILHTKRSRPFSEGINRNLVTIIVCLSHSRLSYIIISYQKLSKIVRLAVMLQATAEGLEQLRLSYLIMGQKRVLMSGRYFPPRVRAENPEDRVALNYTSLREI